MQWPIHLRDLQRYFRGFIMYSQYDFIEFLTNISFFLHENWWKIIIFGIIFVAGIIKIFEWIF